MSKISLLSLLSLPDKSNWKSGNLKDHLISCYSQKLYVDAEIRVQEKTFEAHKNILAFYSPFFQRAFYGIKDPPSLCVINNIKPEGFSTLLRFLYTSEIPEQTHSDDLVEACFAAQILEMVGMGEKLANYIFRKIKPPKKSDKIKPRKKGKKINPPKKGKKITQLNFWPLLEKCRSLKLRDLEEKLLNFAVNNFAYILYCEDFATAESDIIKLVLNKKPLDVPDSNILERIAHWRDSNIHLESLYSSVKQLLTCVDFDRLSPKEFCTVLSQHSNLIKKKDSLDILMHLVDPTVCSLPVWCNVGDKCFNILSDRETEDFKTGKSKSLDDLWPVNNLTSGKGSKAFQSQQDLRKIRYAENLEKRNGKTTANPYKKTLSQNFYQMLEEGLFTDITLVAEDGTKVHAHRLVLASRSEVFAKLIYGATPLKTLRIEVPADDLKTMLRFFYRSAPCESFPSSLESILRITDMALKYQCYPLLRACDWALSSITLEPCVFWKLVDHLNQFMTRKRNFEALLMYAVTPTKDLFDHESFYKSSENSLLLILKCDYLNIEECDLLEYVARWLEANADNFPTDRSRIELFKNIRFQALSTEQLFAFLQKHDGLLPKEDSFAILEFLFHQTGENPLPEWCYIGPLRSVFYKPSMKIGTNIVIPWNNDFEKSANSFICSYKVSISDRGSESQIQFLELSLKFKCSKVKVRECNCSVIIKPDDGSRSLPFHNLKILGRQRLLFPVFFSLDSKKSEISFDVKVIANRYYQFHFIKTKKMYFENVVLETKLDGRNCLSDAIVDNVTSEQIRIPKYLLPKDNRTVVPTEECFQVNG